MARCLLLHLGFPPAGVTGCEIHGDWCGPLFWWERIGIRLGQTNTNCCLTVNFLTVQIGLGFVVALYSCMLSTCASLYISMPPLRLSGEGHQQARLTLCLPPRDLSTQNMRTAITLFGWRSEPCQRCRRSLVPKVSLYYDRDIHSDS